MKWIFYDKGKVSGRKSYKFPEPYIYVQSNIYAWFIRIGIRYKLNSHCITIRIGKFKWGNIKR